MSDEMDEIWALYADDGAQALDAMERALDALGSGPADQSDPSVAAFFRAVHTFKGNSRVLGLAVVESRAHYAEDLIGLVRDQGVPWDGEIRDILLLATDTLRTMLEETAASRADVDPAASEPLMVRLQDKIARCSGTAPAAEAAAPAPVDPPATEAADLDMSLSADAAPPPMDAAMTEPAEAPARKGKARKSAAPEVAPPAAEDPQVALAPEPVAESPAEPAAPPVETPVEPPAAPPAAPRLADDPTYRAIFLGMAQDCLAKLGTARDGLAADPEASQTRARREVDGLAHAARQMGLPDWEAALAPFLAITGATAEDMATVMGRIDTLLAGDLAPAPAQAAQTDTQPDATPPSAAAAQADPPASPAATEPPAGFFAALRAPLDSVARIGATFVADGAADPAAVAACVSAIKDLARAEGYVHVIEAAGELALAQTGAAFRVAELALYEALAAVEEVMPEAALAVGISPRARVQVWCAENVFDTLAALDQGLARLRDPDNAERDEDLTRIEGLFRRAAQACAHHGLDHAGQLALTLLDHFARARMQGQSPDPRLIQLTRRSLALAELVFDALAQGEAPDHAPLEQLLDEVAALAYADAETGAPPAERLDLPEEFRRVISPESLRSAGDALDEGMEFYILRTDLNAEDDMAEAFIGWLSSPALRSITNVSVLQGQHTLFDFLIATSLDDEALTEALAHLDPSLKRLMLLCRLKPKAEARGDGSDDAAEGFDLAPQTGVTASMLERLGEIATAQSTVSHMLTELSQADLAEAIDTALRTSQGDMGRARHQVRSLMGQFASRLQEVAQLDAQLVGQLAQLQEETVQARSLPIDLVLQPLERFVDIWSRQHDRALTLACRGGGLVLDATLLDHLRILLRDLFLLRLQAVETAPTHLNLSFQRDDERIRAVLDDDAGALPASPGLAQIQARLQKMGGDIIQTPRPAGGTRIQLTVPLAMVVLEGMVVGVDGIRYVLPVDAIRMILQPAEDLRLRVSAAEGRELLRIAQDEVVSVVPLTRPGGARDAAVRDPATGSGVYVILGMAGQSVAIPVDELIGQQLVLIRPLRGVLARIANMNGIALLAGGDVGMVVSATTLCAANRPEPEARLAEAIP